VEKKALLLFEGASVNWWFLLGLQIVNVLKEVNSDYVMELKMRVGVLEETELWTWRSLEAKLLCSLFPVPCSLFPVPCL